MLLCFVLISPLSIGQTKKPATPQNKSQVKKPATPQKKVPAKKPATTQPNAPEKKPAVPCNWQKNEVDPFSGVSARMTNWELAGYNNNLNKDVNNGVIGDYRFSISQNIQKKDTTWVLWIKTSTSQNLCFNKDSKIMIKSGEAILTINLTGGAICGESITSSGPIDAGTRRALKRRPMDLIRIYFSNEAGDAVNIDLKEVDKYIHLDRDYFVRTFRCF